jgi:DNA polymerase gamma 1
MYYLHMPVMVSMKYLIKRHNIRAQYLGRHDELQCLVKEEVKYRAVLVLEMSNWWTRAMLYDLPRESPFLRR